jgi:hypothetical protein
VPYGSGVVNCRYANVRSWERKDRHTRISSARSSADTSFLPRRQRNISLNRSSLADALALLLLIAEQDPPRYGRAAARWHGRFVLECGVGLEEARLALAAFASMRTNCAAVDVLAELGTRYRVANLEGTLRRVRAAARSGGLGQ